MNLLIGDFVIWKGTTYRTTSYQTEYALFDIDDENREHQITRIPKDEADDFYTDFAFCDYQGVRYPALQIKDNKCYAQEILRKEKKVYEFPLEDVTEIWMRHNSRKHGSQIVPIYLNDNFTGIKPSTQTFYVEEMANGNFMTAHLDSSKDLNQTIADLKTLYGNRVQIGTPDLNLLLMDYYISIIKIDDCSFCLDYDFGIITISPDDEAGIPYIREIVDYFNQ